VAKTRAGGLVGLSVPACFPALSPQTYQPHRLHDAGRLWPQTNCSVDLWIEVIAAIGAPPEAMLGFTVLQDFEGDQFTFFKAPVEDLGALYGVVVQELAVYHAIERHAAVQLERGRLSLVEVDGFFLPDTRSVSYRLAHGKTTIGINRLDLAARRLEYFHNGGYFGLDGEDFDGLFTGYAHGDTPFLPYAEFVKFGPHPQGDLRATARALLSRRLAQRPTDNPIRRFQSALPEQAKAVATRKPAYFHLYAFNTLRQLGANFELLADHLIWLDGEAGEQSALALRIAEAAKAAQFQLARACARKRFDGVGEIVTAAADAYDALFERLAARD
jgi:hypothetical protein